MRMRVVLGCTDALLTARWRAALPEHFTAEIRPSVPLLCAALDAAPAAWLFLHRQLPGLDAARDLRGLCARPGLRVLVLTDVPDDADGLALLPCGIAAYCNSHISAATLAQVLAVVQLGEIWVGRRLMQALIRRAGAASALPPIASASSTLAALTAREREVTQLLAAGASNKDIARALAITERTVKAHLSAIFHKTGAPDRLRLALLLRERTSAPAYDLAL